MAICLEIKDPSGKRTGHAYHSTSLHKAITIVEEEAGDWVKAKYPHVTKEDHTWTLIFSDDPDNPETVNLPAGSSIDIYRDR